MSIFKKSFWKDLKKKETITQKLCPQCKKPTLIKEMTSGWAGTEFYNCKECGYKGAFYLELDSKESGENLVDLEKLKKLYPEDLDPQTEIDYKEVNFKESIKTQKKDGTEAERNES